MGIAGAGDALGPLDPGGFFDKPAKPAPTPEGPSRSDEGVQEAQQEEKERLSSRRSRQTTVLSQGAGTAQGSGRRTVLG